MLPLTTVAGGRAHYYGCLPFLGQMRRRSGRVSSNLWTYFPCILGLIASPSSTVNLDHFLFQIIWCEIFA